MSGQTYSYSFDDEVFHGQYASVEEALAAAEEAADEEMSVWIGLSSLAFTRQFMPDSNELRDNLAERAGAEFGEYSEDWLSSPFPQDVAEKIDVLLGQIAKIIQQYDPPKFFHIGKTTEHALANKGDAK